MKLALGLDCGQIHYLREVLGIEEIIRPVSVASPARELTPKLIALFPLASTEFPVRGEVSELIVKMITAMKLRKNEVWSGEWIHDPLAADSNPPQQILDLLARAAKSSRPAVLFGSEGARQLLGEAGADVKPGDWIDVSGARMMVTHSPIELLASPGKKAQTWTHLQALMKEL